ncbi:MAG: serine protease, partial [Patescibacteria group bacterium]
MDSPSYQPQPVKEPVNNQPVSLDASPQNAPPEILPVSARLRIFRKKFLIIFGITFLVIFVSAAIAYYFIYLYIPDASKYSEEQVLSFIREEYLPSVVSVYCANEDGGEEYYSGSGIYYAPEGGEGDFGTVHTNAHVVLGDDGKFHGCNVYFPITETGGFYDSSYWAGSAFLYHDKLAIIDGASVNGIDFAALYLTEPNKDSRGISYPFPPVQKGFYRPVEAGKQFGTCSESDSAKFLNFGDKLIVMGYPGIGSKTLTFTEGTINVFLGDYNEQINISAITNSGSSGGIAINASTGCFIGIPTAGTIARGNNIGILLASSFV